MITAGLLLFAALLAILPPRFAGAAWSVRAPRLAILLLQAVSVGVVVAAVLAGLTLPVPAAAVSEGLAAVLDACAATVAGGW